MTTTDDFTGAARAEAERRWPRLPQDPSGHYLSMGKRVGFDLGAQWAAAQEPTDAEVRAAKAEAWDEGCAAAEQYYKRTAIGVPGSDPIPAPLNPYRHEAGDKR